MAADKKTMDIQVNRAAVVQNMHEKYTQMVGNLVAENAQLTAMVQTLYDENEELKAKNAALQDIDADNVKGDI